MGRKGIAAVGLSALAVTTGALVANSLDTSTATQEPSLTLQIPPTYPTNEPDPPFGARVRLGGVDGKNCSQVADVTVRKSTVGLLIKNYAEGYRWWTKTVTSSGDSPPVLRGKYYAGAGQVQTFAVLSKYTLYFANSNCPGISAKYKWNATTINVKVI
jgi:hypothetical protein